MSRAFFVRTLKIIPYLMSGHDTTRGRYVPVTQNTDQEDLSSPRSSTSSTSLRALELSEGTAELSRTSGPRQRSRRTNSISFFQFQNDLLPLSASEVPGTFEVGAHKTIGVFKGVALVAGLQIGSGIFSSPGVVIAHTQSVGAGLLVWLASGILAWTGASSYAELGTSIPLNGGAQAYLAYAYHPLVSYLFAWTSISALKPGGNAIIALIFGEYMTRLYFHETGSDVAVDAIPQWSIKLTACVGVLFVAILCAATPKLGTRAAVVFTSIKVAALISVAIFGIMQVTRRHISSSFEGSVFDGSSDNLSSYALALYSGLWAFEGWDQTNYVAGEMKNPGKHLPLVIHSSMTIVIILFMLANVSYFVLLSKSIVEKSNTVALDFGSALFGRVGSIVFACMVAVSCIGALNGSMYTTSRLICVAGKEGFLPGFFGNFNNRLGTPINALLLNAAITIIFIIVGGGFRTLVNFYSVTSWGFYFLTVLGLLVLRIKEPNLERPYKTWITTPIIFCAVALFLLLMPIVAAPLEALAALGFIALGIPLYFITHHNFKRTTYDSQPSKFSMRRFIMCDFMSWARKDDIRSSGWTRINVDAVDEQVEMLETR